MGPQDVLRIFTGARSSRYRALRAGPAGVELADGGRRPARHRTARSIRCIIRRRRSASSFSTRRAARRTWRRSTTSRSSREMHGKAMPESFTKGQQIAQLQGKPLICFGPQHGFKKFGKSGQEICELFPHIGSVADDVCIIRSMWTEQINHDPAHTIMNTGSIIPGRPSMGSWVLYGLGAETEDLPGFVVLLSAGRGGQMQPIAARQWSAGLLPSKLPGREAELDRRPGAVHSESARA